MKKKALRKDFYMEIKKSLNRFISIFLIVALGVAFYSGIQSAAPDMRYSGDAYFDAHRLMDLKVVGTLGLTDDDTAAIAAIKGIETVEPGYMTDALCSVGTEQKVLHLESVSETLNQLTASEGRLPEKAGEIFVDIEFLDNSGYQIGDEITFFTEEEEELPLKKKAFTIVGAGSSPLYISFNRGNTTLGNGEISGAGYILPEDFDSEVYTQLYLSVHEADELTAYTDAYDTLIETVLDRVEAIAGERCEIRYAEVIDEAEKKLADAKQELEDGKKEGESELADAKQELIDGEKKLKEGESELEDARQEIADGEKELADGEQEIADNKIMLEQKQRELDAGKAQLADGWNQLNIGKQEFAAKEAKFNKVYASSIQEITDGETQLAKAEKQLEEGKQKYKAGLQDYETGLAQYQAGEAQYTAGLAEFQKQEAAWPDTKAALETEKAKLEEQLAQAEAAYPQVEEGLAQAQEQKAAAEAGAAALQMELDGVNGQIAALNQSIFDAAEGISARQQEIAALEAQIQELENQLEQIASQSSNVPEITETTTEEEESEIKRLQAEEAARAATEEELRQQIAELRAQIAVLDTEIQQLTVVKAEAEAALPGLQEQTAFLTTQLEAARQGVLQATDAVNELTAQLETLNSSITALQDGIRQYADGITQGEKGIAQGKEQLRQTRAQLDAVKSQLDQTPAVLEAAKKELEDGAAEIEANKKKLSSGKKQLEDGKRQLEEARAQISANETTLINSQATLADGENQLKNGWSQLAEAEQTLADAKTELSDGRKEIIDAEKELVDSRKELEDGWREYRDGLKEFKEEITDAEKKITDAEKEIADIKYPEWMVTDRSSLPENIGYGENADRIRNIGQVFPVMFFLVAALISLTTMTRMVEEERTQIGTLKALGYGKAAIASKYMTYALTATLGGSIFGILLGEKLLPYIIVTAYRIMYHHMTDIVLPYNIKYAFMATGAALFCTLGATFAACASALADTPAVLMRPPAPKEGKRVLLERLPFLWKHLNFIWKSTMRNLFRYKKRFFMTVFGIGGCMALMLVGYGLRDSISDIGELQYGTLQLYDGMIILDGDASKQEKEELTKTVSDDTRLENSMKTLMQKMSVSKGKKSWDLYLMVPEELTKASDFLIFRDRKTHESYMLSEEGAIVTEKIASLLGVGVGDTILLEDEDDISVEVPIAAVTENYLSHYIYLTPGLYEQLFKETPEYNQMMFRVKEGGESAEEIGETFLKYSAALSISYSGSLMTRVNDMLSTLDSVIIVLIISAGLLAFVVLYNLSNININERRRELATIKVLGFYDSEVDAYVYRENILITVIGILAGVVLGKILHYFVIITVEIDSTMFGRNIDLLSFVISGAFTALFSLIVNIAMHFKLKKIDMVESLKSVE